MRKALALTAAAALAVGLAGPSMAAAKKPTPKLPKSKPFSYTDQAGDGNGINGQGLADLVGQDVPAQSTPADRSAADIIGVGFSRIDNGKQVTGMSVSLKLSAAPDRGTFYRVEGVVSDCSIFWFEYGVDLTGAATTVDLTHNCGEDPTSLTTHSIALTAHVVGTSIVWTVPLAILPAGLKVGLTIDGMKAETRGNEEITAPVIDQAASDGSYKIGQ